MKKSGSYEDITEKTTVVWIGEQIDLICRFEKGNTGAVLSNFNWTIPPIIVSNFFVSTDQFQTNGHPIPFPTIALTKSNVVFHWVRGSVGEVKCAATVAGQQVEAKALFDVRNVDAQWIGTVTGAIAIDTNTVGYALDPVPWMHFGTGLPSSGSSQNNGITFQLTNADLGGYPTNLHFAFLGVQRGLGEVWINTGGTNRLEYGEGLDTRFPSTVFLDRMADSDGDSPGVALHSTDAKVKNSNSFDTFLMWQSLSRPSIPVPIRMLHWNYSAVATNSSGTWYFPGVNSTNVSITTNNTPTTQFPQWSNNMENRIGTNSPPF